MAMEREGVVSIGASVANGQAPQGSSHSDPDNKGQSSVLDCDPWIYRMVVGLLGLVMLTGIGGTMILALSSTDKPTPDIFLALGSAAVGALAGLLAPSPAKK